MPRRRSPRNGFSHPASEARAQRRPVVVYARVSSKEQEREGFSIPAQQKMLQSYADDHGLTVVKEYIDVGG